MSLKVEIREHRTKRECPHTGMEVRLFPSMREVFVWNPMQEKYFLAGSFDTKIPNAPLNLIYPYPAEVREGIESEVKRQFPNIRAAVQPPKDMQKQYDTLEDDDE